MEKKRPPKSHSEDKTTSDQRKKSKSSRSKTSNPVPQKNEPRPSLLKRRILEAQTTFVPSPPCPNYGGYSMPSHVAPQYTSPPVYSSKPLYSLPRSVGYLTRSCVSPCCRGGLRPHEFGNPAYKPYWRVKDPLARAKDPHINRDDLRRKTLETVRRLDAQRMSQRFNSPRNRMMDMDDDFDEIERVRVNALRRQEYIKHYSSYVEGCERWMGLNMINRNRIGKFENGIPNNLGKVNITPSMNVKEDQVRVSDDVCRKFTCKKTMISFKNYEKTCEINVTLREDTDESEKTQSSDERKFDEEDIQENINEKFIPGTACSEEDLYDAICISEDLPFYDTQDMGVNTDMDNENDKGIQSHPSSHEYSTANEHDITDKNKTEDDNRSKSSSLKTSSSKVYVKNVVKLKLQNALQSTPEQDNDINYDTPEQDIDKVESQILKVDGKSRYSSEEYATDSKDYVKNIVEKDMNNALQSNTKTNDSKDYLESKIKENLNDALRSKNVDESREIQSQDKSKSPEHLAKSSQRVITETLNDKIEAIIEDTDSHESEWIKELVDNETIAALSRDTINTSENKIASLTEPIENTSVLSKYIINTHDSIDIEKSLESFVPGLANSDLTLENTESPSLFAFSTSQNIYRMSCPNMITSLKEKYQIRSQSEPYFTYSDLDELDYSFLEEKFSDRIRTTLAFPSDSFSRNRIVRSSESLSSDAISLYMRNLEVPSNCTESTLIRMSSTNSNILGDIESDIIRNTVDMSTEMFAQDLELFLSVDGDSNN